MRYIDVDNNVFISPLNGEKMTLSILQDHSHDKGYRVYVNTCNGMAILSAPWCFAGHNTNDEIGRFCAHYNLFPKITDDGVVFRSMDMVRSALYFLDEELVQMFGIGTGPCFIEAKKTKPCGKNKKHLSNACEKSHDTSMSKIHVNFE